MATLGSFLGKTFHHPAHTPVLPAKTASLDRVRDIAEPRLAELVGVVVSRLREAGRPSIPVTDPHGRHWARAFALGKLRMDDSHGDGLTRTAVADVVLDGSGRMVLDHPVQVSGAPLSKPLSCPNLADSYERLIRRIAIADPLAEGPVFLTRSGQLMIARRSLPDGRGRAPEDGRPPEAIPLSDFLSALLPG